MQVGLPAKPCQPFPARILRRSAPAHRHRARACDRTGFPGRRRAGVGARRVDPGAGAGAARGSAHAARAGDAVHQPRSAGGAPSLRPRRRDVSRPRHGGRSDRGGVRRAATSLYGGSAVGRAEPRHRAPAHAHSASRRAAKSGRTAVRLRVSNALSLCTAGLRRSRARLAARSAAPVNTKPASATTSPAAFPTLRKARALKHRDAGLVAGSKRYTLFANSQKSRQRS